MNERKIIRKSINVKGLQWITFILSIIDIVVLFFLTLYINKIVTLVQKEIPIDSNTIICISLLFVAFIVCYIIEPISYKCLYIKARNNLMFFCIDKIMQKEQKYFNETQIGHIQMLIDDSAWDVSAFYACYYIKLVTNLISLISFLTLIFIYSWILGLFVFVALVLIVLSTSKISSLSAKLVGEYQVGKGIVNEQFLETFRNISLIKMLKKKGFFFNKYYDTYQTNRYKLLLKHGILNSLYTTMYAIILFILPMLTLILGVILKDFLAISLGATISVYTILGNLQEPIRGLADIFSEYKKNQENMKILLPILDIEKQKTKTLEDFKIISFTSKGLVFENKTILKDVHFDIEKNDFILICGQTGCGKSTIFRLLTSQLIDRENIRIQVDKNDFSEYDVFPNLLMIQQKSSLFHTSVKENICCGQDYSIEERKEIYRVCMLEDFIEQYTEDKIIDNTDSNISGGEKQRICIARILIRIPKILLMDEITSALDDHTSAMLAKNIYDYAKKNHIVVLAISHKKEFDEYANKIIHLE